MAKLTVQLQGALEGWQVSRCQKIGDSQKDTAQAVLEVMELSIFCGDIRRGECA